MALPRCLTKSVLRHVGFVRCTDPGHVRHFVSLRSSSPKSAKFGSPFAKSCPRTRDLPVLTRRGMLHTRRPDGRWPDEIDHIRDTIELKHTKWGFVIYRCTYSSDEQWSLLVDSLRQNVTNSLARRDALDLLETFVLDVREDRTVLDGASVDKIRNLFQTWLLSDGKAECPDSQRGFFLRHGTPEQMVIPLSARYLNCVHVDADALASVVASLEGGGGYPFVNVVDGMTGLLEPPPKYEEDEDEDEEGPGYMRVHFEGLMPSIYGQLDDLERFKSTLRDGDPMDIWLGGACYASEYWHW